MSDDNEAHSREQIALAAGALAILLAFTPAYAWLGKFRAPFMGGGFGLAYGYVATLIAMGLAVYAYGFGLAVPSRKKLMDAISSAAFFAGLIMPPSFFAMYIVGIVVAWLFPREEYWRWVGLVLNVILGLIGLKVLSLMQKKYQKDELEKFVKLLASREERLLERSLQLLGLGHYDMAVIQATNALVAAAKRQMTAAGVETKSKSITEIYSWLRGQPELASLGIQDELERIGELRNSAAHGELEIGKDQAHAVVSKVSKLLENMPKPSFKWKIEQVHGLSRATLDWKEGK